MRWKKRTQSRKQASSRRAPKGPSTRPTVGPGQRRPGPGRLTKKQQVRVDQTVEICADVVIDGWEGAVGDRVASCLTESTRKRLFGGRRHDNCSGLANLAKAILEGKKRLHQGVGQIAGWLASKVGAEPLEQTVARELAKRIPIPVVDEKAVAVARGLQVVGILVCLSSEIPLNRCQSFIDLSLAESQERVKDILAAALEDWTSPPDRMRAAWTGRTTKVSN